MEVGLFVEFTIPVFNPEGNLGYFGKVFLLGIMTDRLFKRRISILL